MCNFFFSDMDPFSLRIGCKYFFLDYMSKNTNNWCQSVVVLPIIVAIIVASSFQVVWLVAAALESENRISQSLPKDLLYSFGSLIYLKLPLAPYYFLIYKVLCVYKVSVI